MKTSFVSAPLRGLLCWSVAFLFVTVLSSNLVSAQSYEVGDKITVMVSGEFVETTVTGVDGRHVKYNVTRRGGQVVEESSPMGLVAAWMASASGDEGEYAVDSRTQVGFRSSNGVMRFPTRTWVKQSGEQFRAKLKVLDTSTFMIQLVKEDGTELEIDINDLDETDNTYMRKLAEQVNRSKERSTAGGRGGSRFGGPGSRGGRRGGRGMDDNDGGFGDLDRARGSEASKYPVTKLKTDGIKKFETSSSFSPSVPSWQPSKLRNVSIPFDFAGEGSEMHVTICDPVFSSNGKFAAVGMYNPIAEQSKIVVFDLERRKIHSQKRVPSGRMMPLAISPDNGTLVTWHGFGIEDRIFFWTIDSSVGKLEFKKSWQADSMVKMGAYLDASRLALATSLQVVIFDSKDNRALSATDGQEMFSVIGGAGYTIDKSNDGNYVVDIGNQTRNKFSDRNQRYFGNHSINSNGRLFATYREGATTIYDLTNGRKLVEMSGFSGGTPRFVGSRFVIVGRHLYDMRLQAAVAKFDTGQNLGFQPISTRDGSLAFVLQPDRQEKRYEFVIADLLTPELGERITQYTAGDPIKIGPGTSIAVNTKMDNRKIPGELKKYFTDAGLRISSNAKIVVEAEVERLPSVTVNTGEAGKIDRQITSVTYSPTVSHLRLRVDGVEVFSKRQENNPGGLIRRKQNESVQAAARRMSNPRNKFFTSGGIPTKLNLYPGEMPVVEVSGSGFTVR